MGSTTRLGGFVLVLALVLAGSHVVGRVTAPPAAAAAAPAGPGLSVLTDDVAPGGPRTFAFHVLRDDGTPLTQYADQHGKPMHLIVVRRDLTTFRHVHPELGADGVWRVPLTFAEPGGYRVFADHRPLGSDRAAVPFADVRVTGEDVPRPLPPASATAVVDGYTVTMTGDLRAGREGTVTTTVTRAGRPVTDLQPYLGAYGHLVALRAGDLAYLHVHPTGTPEDGVTRPGPDVTFGLTPPSEGTYRLFLDFRHRGVVRTAAFTVPVGPADATPPQAPGHGAPGHGGPAQGEPSHTGPAHGH